MTWNLIDGLDHPRAPNLIRAGALLGQPALVNRAPSHNTDHTDGGSWPYGFGRGYWARRVKAPSRRSDFLLSFTCTIDFFHKMSVLSYNYCTMTVFFYSIKWGQGKTTHAVGYAKHAGTVLVTNALDNGTAEIYEAALPKWFLTL